MQKCRASHIERYRCAADGRVAENNGEIVVQEGTPSQPIKRLTVILPVYNEQNNIKTVVTDILRALSDTGLIARILLVDDGSSDGSLSVVQNLAADDQRISYLSFSRNFGKEAALMAGLLECGDDHDAVAYMDSDGQHTATDLLRLIEAAQDDDTDLVCGIRVSRDYQSYWQQTKTGWFYTLFRKLSDAKIDEGAGDFNVMKPEVVRALRTLREEYPFMKGLVGWIGFRKKLVPISIARRGAGDPKFSTYKMIKLALGAILSFSSWPLRAWSAIGVMSALLAVLYLFVVIAQTVIFGREVPGYATTVILLLGLGGLQLLSIGVVGEYVARIYDASKNRPRYIVAKRGGPPMG